MLLAYSHFLWLYDGDYILQSLYSFTISYKKYFEKNIYISVIYVKNILSVSTANRMPVKF